MNRRYGILYKALTVSLLLARVYARDGKQGCQVHVLKTEPLSVPIVDGKGLLKLSPIKKGSLLEGISFIGAEDNSSNWCHPKNNSTWWQIVKLTVQDENLKVESNTCMETVKIVGNNVQIRNRQGKARLVAVNCEDACPIIDSTSMNEIYNTHIRQDFVYGRRTSDNGIAVLSNFTQCSLQATGNLNCGCGNIDFWKRNMNTWEKLTEESQSEDGNTEIAMVQIVYSSGMVWSLGCKPTNDQIGPASQVSPLPDYTRQNSEDVIAWGRERIIYVCMTFAAILNTSLLLLILLIYQMKKQNAGDTEKRSKAIKGKLRKFIDNCSAFHRSFSPSQVIFNKKDSHSRHSIQRDKKVQDDSHGNTHLPHQDSKTNNEKQCSPKPTLPSTCPPPFPHPELNTNMVKNSLPPLPCSSLVSHSHGENLQSSSTNDVDEEEDEYDYLELPIITQRKVELPANGKQEETNE